MKLRYDWAGIIRLQSELGEQFDDVVTTAGQSLDLTVLAKAAAAGSGPDVTAEDIISQSPPIIPLVAEIMRALREAFQGSEGTAGAAENPPMRRPFPPPK